MADRDPVPLPAEVRAKLAELELELSEGEYLNFTAELGGSAPAQLLLLLLLRGCEARCRFGLLPRGRTGSEFELRGGKVWSSNCHKFKSICPHSLSTHTHAAILAALVYLAVIWMQGMWCFGGVAVRRKQTRHYSILLIFS